ncbi:hypothetical protein B0H11DRAFT_2352779 [Mycena galericulata]|nr:hypothetical protein B0H11DRAFT_2352779 [Mycena galericulata]
MAESTGATYCFGRAGTVAETFVFKVHFGIAGAYTFRWADTAPEITTVGIVFSLPDWTLSAQLKFYFLRCAFSPRKPTCPPSPEGDNDDSFGSIAPVLGNSLIIRGVFTAGSPITATSAVLVARAVITRILDSNADLPLVSVHQFSTSKPSSSCYLRVVSDPDDSDKIPRFDLLEPWITALRAEMPEWDVAWQPSMVGKDKRMTVRFPDAGFKKAKGDNTPCASLEKVKAALTAQGCIITDSYSTPTGSFIALATPSHDGHVTFPSISPNPIAVLRCRQIEVEHAFEIVISGISEGEGAQASICRWISKMIRDPIEKTSCLIDARSPDNEPDCLVVWMTDWDATSRLLAVGDDFDDQFKPKISSIHRPQLLVSYNNEGLYRPRTITQTFQTGADSMNEELKAFCAELSELRRESRAQHEATQLSVTALNSSVSTLFSHVEQMSTRLTNQTTAFLAMSTENSMRSQLTRVQMMMAQHRSTIKFGDEEDHEAAKDELRELKVQEVKLSQSLMASAGKPVALLGGTLGSTLRTPIVPPGLSVSAAAGSRSDRPAPDEDARNKRARLDVHDKTAGDSNMLDAVSCSTPRLVRHLLIATREATMKSVKLSNTTRAVSRVSPSRDFHGVLSFAEVRDVPRCEKRVLASRKNSVSSLDTKYNAPAPTLLLLLCLCVLVNVVSAAANAPFSMYALNMNGIGGPAKISHVNSVISLRNPHSFVITETKTNEKLSSKLPSFEYNIFEEDAVPQSHGKAHKWGVAVGIRKDVQISQRVSITEASLRGRLLAIDIIMPTDSGRGYIHRVIGIYAPWDPGINNVDPNARQFWADVTEFCRSTTTSWSMAGDYNATVAAMERAADKSDARAQFNKFLTDASAHDLWSDVRDRDRKIFWTSKARGSKGGGNICVLEAPASTDHRAVVGKLVYAPPPNSGSYTVFPEVAQVFNQPRIKYPFKSEKHRFTAFKEEVDRRIQAEGIHQSAVIDDDSFTSRYKALTNILIPCAEECFGRTYRYNKRSQAVTSPKIEAIVSSIHSLGGSIRHVKSDFSARMSFASMKTFNHYAAEFSRSSPSPSLSLLQFLATARRQLHKDLYAEKTAEIYARAKLQDRNRMIAALRGGSTKKLAATANFVSLPRSISSGDGSGKMLSEPEAVKEETRAYFSKLYGRLPPVTVPKPWLTTPSVLRVKEHIQTDPFEWPKPASIADFRALLRRGNQKPSPGPDQWEKWCIKALSDSALALVLDLHNYTVMHSRFPGDLKDMWITMFHKRGLLTDLTNWRGLFLSNFLANSPISWLTIRLTAYSSRMGIVPETQVAVQQGVQTRDLMSFLAGIQTWAERHKETVVALKRDQMKGFDYLAPEGFYDVIRAYGLPEAIIEIDRASQTDTECCIRTFYGPTSPILVSGVTKQGGPASPLKAIYTTSLGHRYLDDLAAQHPDSLVITTANALNADPHLPNDSLRVVVTMVEATDDSFIFAKSLRAAQFFCLHMERFQFAYGWLTQWRKTFAYILNDADPLPLERLSFPSVTIAHGIDPWTIKYYDVPIIRTGLDFLNAKVDDPGARFTALKDIVDAFAFPRLTGRIPLTLLRKMVDAEALDARISTKIHAILGMPFNPSSKILTLPISLHGFGFPSFTRINAGIAVDGISRDLNHHITAYRAMARITLSEWTCNLHNSHCIYPLDGEGLSRVYTPYYKKIPAAWITAHGVMSTMKPPLSLRVTDHNDLLRGETSISHIITVCNHHLPDRPGKPDGNTLRTLRGKGIRQLADMGEWRSNSSGELIFQLDPPPFNHRWTAVQRANWTKTADTLCSMDVSWLFSGPSDLLASRETRRFWAEERIRALVPTCGLQPSATSGMSQMWDPTAPCSLHLQDLANGVQSQRSLDLVPLAPIPTFTMDDYTFYRDADGWIEANIRVFVDHFMASELAGKLALGHRLRMITWVHDTQPPPEYSYTRAVSAHSAVI